MKKFATLLVILSVGMFSFVGCGKKDGKGAKGDKANASQKDKAAKDKAAKEKAAKEAAAKKKAGETN